MSQGNLRMDGRYHYRNGEPARILCVDSLHELPVVSMDRDGNLWMHSKDGKSNNSETIEDAYDLIEVKEKKRLEFWVNIFPNGNSSVWDTKDDAENDECFEDVSGVKNIWEGVQRNEI